jgi:uncharacterized RDD family membrane protein YckC
MTLTREAEAYVQEVVARLPRWFPARDRIEADLRNHLAELQVEDRSATTAVERMGPPERVAAEMLAAVPLIPASLSRRFLAFVLDLVIIVIPFLPMFYLAVVWQEEYAGGTHPMAPLVIGLSIILGLLAIGYFPVLEAVYGQTLGKRLVGTGVVREDGSRIGWVAAILRRLPFFMNFFPIDALFVFFTARRQRAFDKVAGTLVIGCRQESSRGLSSTASHGRSV